MLILWEALKFKTRESGFGSPLKLYLFLNTYPKGLAEEKLIKVEGRG